MNFESKNVVITGGSTGIGFATAKAFIEKGANVWITGRSAENLQKAAAKIDSQRLKTVVSDTSNLAGIAVLEKAVAENGIKIDVLFLNAGTAVFNSIEEVTEADFDTQFNTNVKGSFFTLQKLLHNIKNGGAILFTSSAVATAANLGSRRAGLETPPQARPPLTTPRPFGVTGRGGHAGRGLVANRGSTAARWPIH